MSQNIEEEVFLIDFCNTISTEGFLLEVSFAASGGSKFTTAEYLEKISPERYLEFSRRCENVSILGLLEKKKKFVLGRRIKRSAINIDVSARNFLVFDFDAKDLIGYYKELSNEEKYNAVMNLWKEIGLKISEHQLPIWFVNFSGNGLHFYFKLKNWVKNSASYSDNYRKLLENLSAHLDLPFDKACSNAARAIRLPLSTNYKDENHPIKTQLLYYKDCYSDDYVQSFSKQISAQPSKVFNGKKQLFRKLNLEKILNHFKYNKFDSIKDTGDSLILSSPLRNDKIPSFSYSKNKKLFFDFAEGEGGDLLTLIAKLADLDIKEDFKAVVQYAKKIAGIVEEFKETSGSYQIKESGVWLRASEKDDLKEGYWICSPLEISAYSRDMKNESWGRILLIRDRDGKEKCWPMPMEMLAGDGIELRKKLLNLGVQLNQNRVAKGHLLNYITCSKPSKFVRTVSRVGYVGKSFILPEKMFGRDTNEEIFLTPSNIHEKFFSRGTLDEWKENIGRYAEGNSILTTALCASFSASLLYPCSEENFGLHFFGPSSSGKSITLDVAGSVWGGGKINGYKTRWRSTVNGLESLAYQHNDTLLTLDELAEIAPKSAAFSAYMLANGCGKQRSQGDGDSREAKEWRLVFLSSGEIDLATHLEAEGEKIRAGQELRMLGIEVDQGQDMGSFEKLHNGLSAALMADHLKFSCHSYFGTPIICFLDNLFKNFHVNQEKIYEYRKGFRDSVKNCQSAQKHRALSRFSILYAAGCLACDFGVLPFSHNDVLISILKSWENWSKNICKDSIEEEKILSHIRLYLQTYGINRFPDIEDARKINPNLQLCNGFRKKSESNEYEWLVLNEVFRREFCGGFPLKQVVNLLKKKGILKISSDGKSTIPFRCPGVGRVRCYLLSGNIFSS